MDKRCTKCGETKPPGEFHRDSKRPDGLWTHCKSCRKVTGRAQRQAVRHRRQKVLEYRQTAAQKRKQRQQIIDRYLGQGGQCRWCGVRFRFADGFGLLRAEHIETPYPEVYGLICPACEANREKRE